ncbi:carbohydrate ABC transporter substrate-binding protein, CUT1 family [Gracilibacillus ureilyticus]|uniref:Carbohydrate ABC transporter substrate-binding protein, CUT1 family n=1 Tax=Gracilibacillus ureilyticus TaxID=531814 RepID=A0A1H9Q3M0_9BACI|nr:ABC transporter substrate-binding protein [Gracilibacillus ureilyticus]SER54695.1 carbohydrate ABC transporter substrate-binding protein, CUT1 family [Gracilibacillus ureilyticus]
MVQMKKLFIVVFILLMSVFVMACSEDSGTDSANGTNSDDTENNNTNEENESASNDEEVTLVYARGVDTTGAIDLVIEAFEEKHPNINIEFREMPADTGQSHDQYVTMFSSMSSEVDVFDADVIWPAEFAQANYALELDRFIQRDGIDMDAYFPGTVAAANFNGKQWAMPKFTDAGMLYYRTDIVEEAPETWDDLIKQASELQGEQGTQFGYLMQAAQYEGLVCNYIEFIASYGGQVIDENNNIVVNSPETIKGLEKLAEIVNSDFVPDNILNFMETETENAWIAGDAVFARNWPYLQASSQDEERSSVVDKVDIAPLPAGDAGHAATLGGWMGMINRYTEHPEEAWEFLKFMTGEEGQKIIAVHGGRAPTLEALYDDPEVQEAGPLFSNPEFVKVLQSAVPRPVTPIYPEISDIMQIEISKFLTGDQTAEEAAQNMQTKMEAAMAE